jgi:hypothetical protein
VRSLFPRVPAEVKALMAAGERPLAWSPTVPDGWAVASSERFVCTAPRIDQRWVEVLGASWDQPILELALWQPVGQGTHRVNLREGQVLPQVVRERITASFVVQRYVTIRGSKGVRLLARRDPATDAITWQKVLDPGLDGADPAVAAAVDRALADVRDNYGV